jgi:hypothetical protein
MVHHNSLDRILTEAPNRSHMVIICHHNILKHILKVNHLSPISLSRDQACKGIMEAVDLIRISNPSNGFKLTGKCKVPQPLVALQTIVIKAMHNLGYLLLDKT